MSQLVCNIPALAFRLHVGSTVVIIEREPAGYSSRCLSLYRHENYTHDTQSALNISLKVPFGVVAQLIWLLEAYRKQFKGEAV